MDNEATCRGNVDLVTKILTLVVVLMTFIIAMLITFDVIEIPNTAARISIIVTLFLAFGTEIWNGSYILTKIVSDWAVGKFV